MTTIRDDGDTCPRCGGGALWEACPSCGGEGAFDWETLQFDDPLWYQPGDTERCEECGGKGGSLFCIGTCGAAGITVDWRRD